ncbi:MAG TPA: hypothetical protein VFB38_15505, partial [Chthonomonadaceae bacterium]|nr:hypothetical protein [Chthonomonadaceae bacterium]
MQRFYLALALLIIVTQGLLAWERLPVPSPKRQSPPNSKGASVPSGLIVYSAQVDASEYTSTLGRFDLFLQTTGDGKTLRLTDHRAHPE